MSLLTGVIALDTLPVMGWSELFLPDPGSLIVVAFLMTIIVALRLIAHADLDTRIGFWACVWGIFGALSGGHLSYLLLHPQKLIENPLLFFNITEGGKGVFGAFIGAGLSGWIYLKWKKVPLLAYADATAPAVALGYAIARIGCFLNGDDFGTLSSLPWAVQFPRGTEAFADHLAKGWINADSDLSLPVHPVQLYHAAAGLTLFVVLLRWKGKWTGSRLTVAIAYYGVIRFTLQFYRGDATPILGFLDIGQIFSMSFLIAAYLLWRHKGKIQRLSNEIMSFDVSTETLSQKE